MSTFILNGASVSADVAADTPLLWFLRDHLQMTGTKFGCGAGLCGACTVIVDGRAMRSCVTPVAALDGKTVETIESLGGDHPVQQAWTNHSVPQCGYCQPGQVMSTVALLRDNPAPNRAQVQAALAGNICRCGTYHRILQAIDDVVALAGTGEALFYNAAATTVDTEAAP